MDQKFNTKDRMIFFGIKPSKSLGQNFLNDISVVQEIVYSAKLTKEDIVVEVGPGLGVMTDLLANEAGLVIAVEIDKNLIPPLQAVCDVHDNIELINGDILKVNIREIVAQRIEESNGTLKNVKVVANLPYYITTPIIFSFLENKMPQLRSMTFMVQKEAAIALGMTGQAVTMINEGAPLKIVFFEEGAPCSLYGHAMTRKAESREDYDKLKEVFDYLVKVVTPACDAKFFPEQVFVDKVFSLPNYPENIPYGDMSNNTTEEKTRLLEKWMY